MTRIILTFFITSYSLAVYRNSSHHMHRFNYLDQTVNTFHTVICDDNINTTFYSFTNYYQYPVNIPTWYPKYLKYLFQNFSKSRDFDDFQIHSVLLSVMRKHISQAFASELLVNLEEIYLSTRCIVICLAFLNLQ